MLALAITGPTASGKTAISLSLSERYPIEIISSDSMQIYRGMNIGTAKATAEEQSKVPHHLIDLLSPTESYSAQSYREDALRIAREITERGRLPLFVGGTGLYIDTLMRRCGKEIPESDPVYRDRILSSLACEADIRALWDRLREVDPESAEKIHMNNVKRVIRALEIYDKTGRPKSELDKQLAQPCSDIDIRMITVDFHNRENLYSRVNLRVDEMMREGLLSEVSELYARGLLIDGSTASQAIGYKELVAHLEGECTLGEAVEKIKLSSRRYAKRQLTWFRHVTDAVRIYRDREDGSMKSADELLSEVARAADRLITTPKSLMKGIANETGRT